jgi:hypothetical protein
MFTLDCALVTNAKVKCKTLQDELRCDVAFPMVDARKLTMEDGCSLKQKQNPKASSMTFEKEVSSVDGKELVSSVDGKELSSVDGKNWRVGKGRQKRSFSARSAVKCLVWIGERDRVIANDKIVHGHLLTVANRTRREIAFRHMFHVANSGHGETGVSRHRHFECVEDGVRSLFQDGEHMGFKQE